MVNVLDKLPKKAQMEAKTQLQKIAYAEGVAQADQGREKFIRWCEKGDYKAAAETLERDWERMVSFHQFPKEHWKSACGGRTTNPVESPFAALRLRTDAAKRYKKVENATAVIFSDKSRVFDKILMLAERRFRRLNAPDQMKQVFLGVQFKDGVEVKQEGEQRVAA